jgi:hypothetical protein
VEVSPARRLLAQRHLAVLICAAALALKLLVPAGYMIDRSHGRLTITICTSSTQPLVAAAMPTMDHAMPDHDGMDHGRTDHGKGDTGRAEMPCLFSSLSAAVTQATDPIQIAALIAFVMTSGIVAVVPSARPAPAHLRPPLRGPPAFR